MMLFFVMRIQATWGYCDAIFATNTAYLLLGRSGQDERIRKLGFGPTDKTV